MHGFNSLLFTLFGLANFLNKMFIYCSHRAHLKNENKKLNFSKLIFLPFLFSKEPECR